MILSFKKIGYLAMALVALVGLIWFGVSFYLVVQSPSLIYQPERSKNQEYTVPTRSEFLQLETGEDIEVLIAEANNPEKAGSIIVYFHGNEGQIPDNIAQLTQFGTVVSPAYPGYSQSSGTPNTKKIHDTATATLEWLKIEGVSPKDITLFGHSLGGSVVVYAATQYPQVGRLIVVNTLYSIQRQCQIQYGIACILSGSIHNSAAMAQDVSPDMPVYHFHNVNDERIPYSHGQDLFEIMPSTDKTFSNIEGTHGHFDATWVMQEVLK